MNERVIEEVPTLSDDQQDITDRETGGSRLLSQRCATCVFRSGNPMHLASGRLAELLSQALPDGFVVCHDTLSYGPNTCYGPAMCRGFYDAYGDRSLAVRLLNLYGHIVEVPPPRSVHDVGPPS